jgi:hypothetical protein
VRLRDRMGEGGTSHDMSRPWGSGYSVFRPRLGSTDMNSGMNQRRLEWAQRVIRQAAADERAGVVRPFPPEPKVRRWEPGNGRKYGR